MKTVLYRILILILIAAGACADIYGASKKEASMKFQESVCDFGNVSLAKGKVSHDFTFVNTGNKNLVITGATVDCGCTKAEYSDEPVAPGKSGKVKITFSPNGRGHFSKKITLRTNGNPRRVHLVIKGQVVK